MLPAENFIDSSIGQQLRNHRNVPTDSPNEPKILKLPEVRERYAALGAEPVGSTPGEFAAYCRSELAKWAGVVKESGAKAD